MVAAREHTGQQPRLEMGFHSSEHGEGALIGSVSSMFSSVVCLDTHSGRGVGNCSVSCWSASAMRIESPFWAGGVHVAGMVSFVSKRGDVVVCDGR